MVWEYCNDILRITLQLHISVGFITKYMDPTETFGCKVV